MALVQVDVSSLEGLRANLNANRQAVGREIRQVVSRGAWNIKRELQQDLGGSAYSAAHAAAAAVEYKIIGGTGKIEAQIGTFRASAANMFFFGTSRFGGGTHGDVPTVAAEREQPKFEQAILAVLDRMGGGLD